MKLYKEAMRRLGLPGIAFLAVSVILTAILCVSSANAAVSSRIDSVFGLMPTLSVFAYAGGLAFAYVGFSFLNKRSDSDFYHSLPISRSAIYVANTLAALTWTVATVLLSALASLIVYLFIAAPFIPAYYPLGISFFIVATMLVYAAAAIAMSLTGTLFSNIVMTGVVLFLPRFLLFMIGRTIVAGVNIVGFWDLQGLLNPRTNLATGLIVMTRRAFLGTDFVTIPNILYSLVLAAVEMLLGGVLFVRRPSELAERGAVNGKVQTLFACLLALPVMLIMLRYVNDIRKLTIAVLIVASLVVYAVYQLIALRSVRRMAKSLPWYLCTLALAFAAFFGMRAVNTAIRDVVPDAAEIRSVQFGLPDPQWGNQTYNDLLVSEIVFDDDAVRECVAGYLGNAVTRLQEQAASRESGYYGDRTSEPGMIRSILPVKITLNNGRVIRRTIEFTNMNALNDARNGNTAYQAAVRACPAGQEMCYTDANTYSDAMPKENSLKIRDCYFEETRAQNVVMSDTHKTQIMPDRSQMQVYPAGISQNYGGFYVSGYHGLHRFYQYYQVDLATPKTAALWMQLNNQINGAESVRLAKHEYDAITAKREDNSQYSANITVTNVPMQDGTCQQIFLSYYMYYYDGKEQNNDVIGAEYYGKALDILARGTLTSDPTSFNVQLIGNAYYETNRGYSEENRNFSTAYLTFAPEDEAALLKLMSEWNEAQTERERIYNPDYAVPEIAVSIG